MKRVPSPWITLLVAGGACAFPACSNDVSSAASATGGAGGAGGSTSATTATSSTFATTSSAGQGAATSSASVTGTGVGGGTGGTGGSHEGCPTGSGGAGGDGGSGAGGSGGASALEIVSASALSRTEILFVFSEALAPTTGVDPTDFRLSAARTAPMGAHAYQGCTLQYTASGSFTCVHGHYYYSQLATDYACGGGTNDYTFYYNLGPLSNLAPVAGHPDELVATVASPLGSVGALPGLPCEGLYLHYAQASLPVKDLAGDTLRPIAPKWAESTADRRVVAGAILPAHPVPVASDALAAYCCSDGATDGHETAVDCGGPTTCQRCADTEHCNVSTDCQSGVCSIYYSFNFGSGQTYGQCEASTCSDTLLGGTETGIDCGGSCPACIGDPCVVGADCASGVCTGNVCVPPAIVAISAGSLHTCALTSAGGVKCWGENQNGGIGDFSLFERLTPVNVVDISGGAIAIAAGRGPFDTSADAGFFDLSCAITTGGGVDCWHYDVQGPMTPVTAISAGGFGLCAVTTAGGVSCWQQALSAPDFILDPSFGAASVAVGNDFACLLSTAGAVKCWGTNAQGELGDGSTTDSAAPVTVSGLTSGVTTLAAGTSAACAVTASGGLVCWGTNANGELGDGTTTNSSVPVAVTGLSSGVAAVSVGGATCALTTAGGVKCWGRNADGEVGDGTSTNRTTPVDVPGLTSGVIAVSCGDDHTCALTAAGRVLCWGGNAAGGLGDGTTQSRSTPGEVYGL